MSVMTPSFRRQHARDMRLRDEDDSFRVDEARMPAPRGDEELPIVDVGAVSEAGEL
jgi:hypothetical protein